MSRRGAAPRSAARPSRTGPSSQSTTTRRDAGAASRAGAPRARIGAPAGVPAVGDDDEQRPARGSRSRSDPQHVGACAAARRRAACGHRSAARPSGAAAASTREVGGSDERRPSCAAEDDQPDLVAPLVGVGQQRQHRALDRAHPLRAPPSSRWRRREQHQVALPPLAHRLAQVAAAQLQPRPGAGRGRLVRRGGTQGRAQVQRRQPARRRPRSPVSRPLRAALGVRRAARPAAPGTPSGRDARAASARNGAAGTASRPARAAPPGWLADCCRGSLPDVAASPARAPGHGVPPPGRRRRVRLGRPVVGTAGSAPARASVVEPAPRRAARSLGASNGSRRRRCGSASSAACGRRRRSPRRARPTRRARSPPAR